MDLLNMVRCSDTVANPTDPLINPGTPSTTKYGEWLHPQARNFLSDIVHYAADHAVCLGLSDMQADLQAKESQSSCVK